MSFKQIPSKDVRGHTVMFLCEKSKEPEGVDTQVPDWICRSTSIKLIGSWNFTPSLMVMYSIVEPPYTILATNSPATSLLKSFSAVRSNPAMIICF